MTVSREAEGRPRVLVGCGILSKEVAHLIAINNWNVEVRFLASSLHNYPARLLRSLEAELETEPGKRPVVLYGACHPGMDGVLARHGAVRTPGQNCIVMLLGYPQFLERLSDGAYFLLEEWAMTWEPMLTECFGDNPEVIRAIFRDSHRKMVAVRTPCSADFSAAAAAAAAYVGLPLEWMDTDLTHLERVLRDAFASQEASHP